MADAADDLVLRVLSADELSDFVELEALAWGWRVHEPRIRWYAEFLAPGHTLGIFHGHRLVAMRGMTRLQLTVPGGRVVDLAGFTCLAVHPLYRNRGLMSRLTRHAFDLVRREGHMPIGAAMPHHSRTHLRYGYGVASRYANVELAVDGRRTLLDVPDDGRLDYVDEKTALSAMHELSARLTGARNGWVPRQASADAYKYSGAAAGEGEFGPVAFVVHHSADGTVDGVLSCRHTAGSDTYGRPQGTLKIIELFGLSAGAEAQLWRHCVSDSLVTGVIASRRPVNDPIVARLPDPRAWRQVNRDDMILCLLDIPEALAARRYSREDAVVIEVCRPAENGAAPAGTRYELTGGLAGATCRPVGRTPDITMSLSALGAAYLGDNSLLDLAASGQVAEHTPGALRRAGAMFSWSPAPWVQDTF
jgi:predicted acetyltransferase